MVDGPFVKICAWDEKTVASAESKSSEDSCKTNREWVGGEPTRTDGKRDEEADRAAKITKSHWKVFEVKAECRPASCAVDLSSINVADAGYKCTGLDHIQFRNNIITEDTLLECGQAAHNAGFEYFSYRTDKKYCYYGEHSSSPHRCEDSMKVKTKSPEWSIYTVDCA